MVIGVSFKKGAVATTCQSVSAAGTVHGFHFQAFPSNRGKATISDTQFDGRSRLRLKGKVC